MPISFWEGTSHAAEFPRLTQEVEADVAIVGGGITGITAAQLLAREGKRVAVLEALRVGLGTTGYSTGNLHTVVDDYLYVVRQKWGDDVLKAVVQSRQSMIELIERNVAELNLDCGLVRRPHYLYTTDASQNETLEKEFDAAQTGGLQVERTLEVPLPFTVEGAFRVDNQAQMHPSNYVIGLAKAIESDTCRIYEHSKAEDIDADAHVIRTSDGGVVRAKKIILATHTPKGFHLVQTELGPYREYGIAGKLSGTVYPDAIFWSLESPHHSVRSYGDHFICIGEKHKTGQHANEEDYFGKVEEWARKRFPIESVDYRWSAQHYKPADALPFIGQSGSNEDLYIATGFSTSGLLYGSLAARILTDTIAGRENPYAEVYRANRFTPAKSAKDFVKENADVAAQYVKDFLRRGDVHAMEHIAPGEGALANIEGKKVALYREPNGEWCALSPVCTHMGCIVHWNTHEKSWDCPCHGSRFKPTGEVLEGPAITALARKEIQE
jgi:glycine/D-amino acid oxidase-like deaminating enzyme/nitrite reductase/ring-hydroxylating ferredoxin subunit